MTFLPSGLSLRAGRRSASGSPPVHDALPNIRGMRLRDRPASQHRMNADRPYPIALGGPVVRLHSNSALGRLRWGAATFFAGSKWEKKDTW
jgi:hypothetical protein